MVICGKVLSMYLTILWTLEIKELKNLMTAKKMKPQWT